MRLDSPPCLGMPLINENSDSESHSHAGMLFAGSEVAYASAHHNDLLTHNSLHMQGACCLQGCSEPQGL